MTGSAAHAWPCRPASTLARDLRGQVLQDLAHSPTGPARRPARYLEDARGLLERLIVELQPLPSAQNREERDLGQDLRHCAVLGRLLQAADNAVEGAEPSRAAWDASRRFLLAAEATIGDLLTDVLEANHPHLRIIDGGRR